MSQLARRENAPHRAAFVTSLSRWYIRRLLGNLPPFHPCLRRGGPVLPLAGLRHPTDIFLGNQGITSRFAFLPVYPELVAVVGGHVPDYRGIFLRGHGSQTSMHYGTVTHSSAGIGQLQGDSIREIWGWFPELISQGSTSMTYGAMSYGSPWSTGSHSKYSGNWMKRSADFYASRVTPVSDEVRPVNRSVKYLIRAK